MSWLPCPEAETDKTQVADIVKTVVIPRAVDVGEMQVRRAMPSKASQMIGPFIFFDQMGPTCFSADQGLDIRPHPHINLATLTYLLEGEILHRDSLGSRQIIRPGAVNWMRAGSGIVHSERTSDDERYADGSLLGVQTWVALPEAEEESRPEFVHHGAGDLPVVEAKGVQARVIAGDAFGARSPLVTASATVYADIELDKKHSISIDSDYVERAIYGLKGEIEIGNDCFPAGQLLNLQPGASTTVVARSDARFILFGGEPMDGPRFIWWNFVSSRAERIRQAVEDWSEGRFDKVPDDEEFIPLPERIEAPRRIEVST